MHDVDSVSIRRLHAEGLSVIERARPWSHQAEALLAVNHSGIADVATVGGRLTSINTTIDLLSVLPRIGRQVRHPTLSC